VAAQVVAVEVVAVAARSWVWQLAQLMDVVAVAAQVWQLAQLMDVVAVAARSWCRVWHLAQAPLLHSQLVQLEVVAVGLETQAKKMLAVAAEKLSFFAMEAVLQVPAEAVLDLAYLGLQLGLKMVLPLLLEP
jgi:hypothetical protein